MKADQRVRLQAYGGDIIERVVIGETDDIVFVCTVDEFRRALEDCRAPICVGFNRKFVIEGVISRADGDADEQKEHAKG